MVPATNESNDKVSEADKATSEMKRSSECRMERAVTADDDGD